MAGAVVRSPVPLVSPGSPAEPAEPAEPVASGPSGGPSGRLASVIATALASPAVRACLVAHADVGALLALRAAHPRLQSDVDFHLLVQDARVLLRPADPSEDAPQHVVLATRTACHTLRAARWWADPGPGALLRRTRTLTLPARRAAAAMRWLYACPELEAGAEDGPGDDDAADENPDENPDDGPGDGPGEDLADDDTAADTYDDAITGDDDDDDGNDAGDADGDGSDGCGGWGVACASCPCPCVCPCPSVCPAAASRPELRDAPPSAVDVDGAEGGDEDDDGDGGDDDDGDDDDAVPAPVSAWAAQARWSAAFPASRACALRTAVLDCTAVGAAGFAPTELAGTLPPGVATVVLHTRPRLEHIAHRRELLASLRASAFPLPVPVPSPPDVPTPASSPASGSALGSGSASGSASYSASTLDVLPPLASGHWAAAHDVHVAYHVPALRGGFGTLVLALGGAHGDALFDVGLVCAPHLRRVVVVFMGRPGGLQDSLPEGLPDESWRLDSWARRPAQPWGILTPLLLRFAGTGVRVDVVDAQHVDAHLSPPPPPMPQPGQQGDPGEPGIAHGPEPEPEPEPEPRDTAPHAPDAPNAPDAPHGEPQPRPSRLGCAFEDLPNALGSTSTSTHRDIDVAYPDSRVDVGRGRAIDPAEWALWTQLYALE